MCVYVYVCVCVCVCARARARARALRLLANALILCMDACISVRECASARISACDWMNHNL